MENSTLGLHNANRQLQVTRVEAEFSGLVREAIEQKRYGQFGLIVSIQSGAIKTYQKHQVETLK